MLEVQNTSEDSRRKSRGEHLSIIVVLTAEVIDQNGVRIVSNNSVLAESWKTHHELTFAWQTTIKLKRKMKQKDTKQAENHQWLKEIYLSVVILNGNGSS